MPRAIAVLGTASDVGKSQIATALGRQLRDAGASVAPVKAQNMSLQAGGTADGGELSRAQILQAPACRVSPRVDMNPVLQQPVSQRHAVVVVLGRARGTSAAGDYFRPEIPLRAVADQALDRLAGRHDVLVLEGAGSPVELNLMDRDFVNLRPARRVNAAPVLVVVPWLAHGRDEEDRPLSLPIDAASVPGKLNVAVALHPHVANTDDIAPLLAEPDVAVTWVTGPAGLAERDLIILPGSKATVADLQHHTASGLTAALTAAARQGAWLQGLCGGYQMLGQRLRDPLGADGPAGDWPGLGFLPVDAVFSAEQHLSATAFRSAWPAPGHTLAGYEIHRGRTCVTATPGDREGGATALVSGAGAEVGMAAGTTVGCYLHGLLAADEWRRDFLNLLRRSRGLPERDAARPDPMDLRIDRRSHHVAAEFRGDAWWRIRRACGLE